MSPWICVMACCSSIRSIWNGEAFNLRWRPKKNEDSPELQHSWNSSVFKLDQVLVESLCTDPFDTSRSRNPYNIFRTCALKIVCWSRKQRQTRHSPNTNINSLQMRFSTARQSCSAPQAWFATSGMLWASTRLLAGAQLCKYVPQNIISLSIISDMISDWYNRL
jgi:hypothetical protein